MLKPLTRHFKSASITRLGSTQIAVCRSLLWQQNIQQPWLMPSMTMRQFTPPTGSKRVTKKKKEKESGASDKDSAAKPEVQSMLDSEVRVKPKKDKATNVRYS